MKWVYIDAKIKQAMKMFNPKLVFYQEKFGNVRSSLAQALPRSVWDLQPWMKSALLSRNDKTTQI